MICYLGIDPGKGGGIAVVDERARAVEATNMPETLTDLWDFLVSRRDTYIIAYAGLELLHALPAAVESKMGIHRGSISTWKLGEHFGKLQMALTAAGFRWETYSPRKWQGVMDCLTGGNKNVSKERAQQLFPGIKITHKTADALLIAETCRRINMGLVTKTKGVKGEILLSEEEQTELAEASSRALGALF